MVRIKKYGFVRIVSRSDDVYAGKLWRKQDAYEIAEHLLECGRIDEDDTERVISELWNDMREDNKRIRAIAKETGKKVKR